MYHAAFVRFPWGTMTLRISCRPLKDSCFSVIISVYYSACPYKTGISQVGLCVYASECVFSCVRTCVHQGTGPILCLCAGSPLCTKNRRNVMKVKCLCCQVKEHQRRSRNNPATLIAQTRAVQSAQPGNTGITSNGLAGALSGLQILLHCVCSPFTTYRCQEGRPSLPGSGVAEGLPVTGQLNVGNVSSR